MKKLLYILACICLLISVSACGNTGEEQPAPTDGTKTATAANENETVDKKYYPTFAEKSDAEKALENLTLGSEGWDLKNRDNFLFAVQGNYVLRYDIAKNQIDKYIYLGDDSGHPFGVSISSDGRYLITYNFDFDNEQSSYNYFLTDLTEETVQLITAKYNKAEAENISATLDLPDEIKGEIKDLRFDVSEKPEEKVDWKNITVAEKSAGSWTVIDDNTLGIIMPTGSENELKSGDYKIVVIDYKQDKIVGECPLSGK